MCNYTLTLLKKVGKDTGINDRDELSGIRHDEIDRHTITLALDTALLNQSADAKAFPFWGLIGSDLGWAEEEDHITLECI